MAKDIKEYFFIWEPDSVIFWVTVNGSDISYTVTELKCPDIYEAYQFNEGSYGDFFSYLDTVSDTAEFSKYDKVEYAKIKEYIEKGADLTVCSEETMVALYKIARHMLGSLTNQVVEYNEMEDDNDD